MRIVKAGFGNRREAFIEDRFSEGVNIIYSNENNKGKTLLIQSILYAMGNESIFPTGFPVDDYYFYTEAIINNQTYKFLRNRKTIVTISDDLFRVCSSLSEFKYFVNENIFKLPTILKKFELKVVDLMLYYQLFFIGQDKRNSSNIFNNGYYNKNDFFSMLCSLNGYPLLDIEENNKDIDKEIAIKQAEIKTLKKTIKFLRDNPIISDYTNKSSDKENFNLLKEDLNKILANISEYKKKRQKSYIRRTNLENLLGELRSISYNVSKGTVCCLNCGSKNISYSNGDIFFDVSDSSVRNEIIESINKQIRAEDELVGEFSSSINFLQDELESKIVDIPLDLKTTLLYSEEIISSKECDEKIKNLLEEIEELRRKKEQTEAKNEEAIRESKEMKDSLLDIMNQKLFEIDKYTNINFIDLFTKNDETYSGSEEQEFYYCKILALDEYFRHEFPLIIDSFRDGELSTNKELMMLANYKERGKQVILTATLKKEEYDLLKYDEMDNITAIDYSIHEENKILQDSYCSSFNKILDMFNVI